MIALGFLGALLAALVAISSSRPAPIETVARPADSVPQQSSSIVLDKFQRSETREGRTVWEVVAARGEYFPQNGSAELSDATVRLYRKQGEQVELKAGAATLQLEGNALRSAHTRDNVTVNYNQKINLKTGEAVYYKEENRISAPGAVEISTASFDVSGQGMEADLEKEEIRILRNVKSVLRGIEPGRSGKGLDAKS